MTINENDQQPESLNLLETSHLKWLRVDHPDKSSQVIFWKKINY